MIRLLPCPFCGKEMDLSNPHTLYKTGTMWREVPGVGRSYISRKNSLDIDNHCYAVNCCTHTGGCGAYIHEDSMEEAITKWNTRK